MLWAVTRLAASVQQTPTSMSNSVHVVGGDPTRGECAADTDVLSL